MLNLICFFSTKQKFSLDISKHIRAKGVWAITTTSMKEASSPLSVRTTESWDRQCVICFQDFRDGNEIGWSVECPHYFHRHCIRSWLMKNPECPCCRRNFLNNGLTVDEGDQEIGESTTEQGGSNDDSSSESSA